MAILDAVKNQVQGQVAARANSKIRSGLTKVAGNLLGINTQFSGPQLGREQDRAPHYMKTKYDTKILTYPIDVDVDERQGHYIFFTVLQTNQAKVEVQEQVAKENALTQTLIENEVGLARAKAVNLGSGTPIDEERANQSAKETARNIVGEQAIVQANFPPGTGQSGEGMRLGGSGDVTRARTGGNSLKMRNEVAPTPIASIALYMPPSVQVSYGADYQDSEIGVFAQLGSMAIQAFKEEADWRTTVSGMVDAGAIGIEKALLATLDTVAPGSKVVSQIQTGRAITPRMELMFNGIGRREFSYEFNFMPRSVQEATQVYKIIKEFKKNMAANFTEDGGFREMYLPNTFLIEYMHMEGKRNDNLNKVSECVLESVNVTYGGDKFQTHPDGVPQSTKMSLKFKELEIITRDMIEQGF